jgi:hypothetical protein
VSVECSPLVASCCSGRIGFRTRHSHGLGAATRFGRTTGEAIRYVDGGLSSSGGRNTRADHRVTRSPGLSYGA